MWISYAQSEFNLYTEEGLENSRAIFQRAYDELKSQGLKEERVLLLDAWMECEKNASKYSLIGNVSRVEKLNPKKLR